MVKRLPTVTCPCCISLYIATELNTDDNGHTKILSSPEVHLSVVLPTVNEPLSPDGEQSSSNHWSSNDKGQWLLSG